ncbi:hypothetical protein HYT53_03565 [Candidatus Woesearchaeota archaeon]|nr:hypothetical protein [Candidatus Woesearchaeota archaeon]
MTVGPSETLGQAAELPAVAAQGDILYYNGTSWVVLTAGTSGQFLKTQGAGANPVWSTLNIKVAVTQWATAGGTTSTTFVDVADATVTISGLDAGTTYDLIAFVTSHVRSNDGAHSGLGLVINGVMVTETRLFTQQANVDWAFSIIGMASGLTGATSYIAKLQTKVPSGSNTINNSLLNSEIVVIAIAR